MHMWDPSTKCPTRLWVCSPPHLPTQYAVLAHGGWGRAMRMRRHLRGSDPMSIAQISCQTLNHMPCWAGGEPFLRWSGLPSNTTCGLALSASTDKARSCSSQPAEDAARTTKCYRLHRLHKEKKKPFQFSTRVEKVNARELLAKPRLKLVTGSANMSPVSSRLCLYVLLCQHILLCPCLQWLVHFHLCLALIPLSLVPFLPAVPNLTLFLTIKLKEYYRILFTRSFPFFLHFLHPPLSPRLYWVYVTLFW